MDHFPVSVYSIMFICICFRPHLEQIVDFKPDQALLQDKINVSSLVTKWLHSKPAKISSFFIRVELQSER